MTPPWSHPASCLANFSLHLPPTLYFGFIMQTEFSVKCMSYTLVIGLILKVAHIQSKMFKLYDLGTILKINFY